MVPQFIAVFLQPIGYRVNFFWPQFRDGGFNFVNRAHARNVAEFRKPAIKRSARGRLRESPDYELSQISERKPGVLDELAAEWAKQLEKESAELEQQAARLAFFN